MKIYNTTENTTHHDGFISEQLQLPHLGRGAAKQRVRVPDVAVPPAEHQAEPPRSIAAPTRP